MFLLLVVGNNIILDTNVKHTTHKLITKVKDESFNVDELQHYNLNLNIGYDSFEFCVIKNETNKCILLEEYVFQNVNNNVDLLREMKLIWDNHHLLKAGFWKKIKVSFNNQQFNFIPKSLFNKSNLEDYISFTSNFDKNTEHIGVYNHISFSGINVFSYPKNIVDYLNSIYINSNLEITHHCSALVEATFRSKLTTENSKILLFVERNHLNLICIKSNELIYANRFYFTSKEDFIYYIILIFKQLKLDVEKDILHIFGEIAPNSPLYDSIYTYIKHSKFGKRPKFLNFSYHFDEFFDHKFLSTYAIHLCE